MSYIRPYDIASAWNRSRFSESRSQLAIESFICSSLYFYGLYCAALVRFYQGALRYIALFFTRLVQGNTLRFGLLSLFY